MRWRQLAEIQLAVATAPTFGGAFRRIGDRVAELTGRPALLFERSASGWRLLTSGTAAHPPLPTADALERATRQTAEDSSVTVAMPDGSTWSAVCLDAGRRVWPEELWLVLPAGLWPPAGPPPALDDARRGLLVSLHTVAQRQEARQSRLRALRAFRFGRRLSRAGVERLCQTVVDTLARAVGAGKAALAFYDDREGTLAIVATHGYPLALVQDVRLQPGTGVMGRVFSSRRPLLTTTAGELPGGAAPRRRYRSASLIALPVVLGDEPLGVITLTEPEGRSAFGAADLRVARHLLAPATLALGRARVLARAGQLAVAATVDPLTGLFNRRYLRHQMEAEVERARRHGLGLGLLMLDLDDFKRINDSAGHPAGDLVLRRVAQTLRRAVRSFDICARYGGDEFAVLLPGSQATSATQTAERICQKVAGLQRDLAGVVRELPLTVSAGVAILEPGITADGLIARADRGLYEAKGAGKGCVRIAQ